MPGSEVVLLAEQEKITLENNLPECIEEIFSTFSHGSRTFEFHNGERQVSQFHTWPAVKDALDRWHKNREE